MTGSFELEYWRDGEFYVGKLKGIPGVFSQGESLEELEENIKDAYHLMIEDDAVAPAGACTKPLIIDA